MEAATESNFNFGFDRLVLFLMGIGESDGEDDGDGDDTTGDFSSKLKVLSLINLISYTSFRKKNS